MPVRGLEAYILNKGLIKYESLSALSGLHLGIDSSHWLRNMAQIKETLLAAIGGAPTSIYSTISQDVAELQKHNIKPLWVFNGLMIPRYQRTSNPDPNAEIRSEAWDHYLMGQLISTKRKFESSMSDRSSPLCFSGLAFWHLFNMSQRVFRAPMLPWAQLVYFLEPSKRQYPNHIPLIDAIYGSTEILLVGASRLILSINWEQSTFAWTDLKSILSAADISFSQFQDACILAGFDGCPPTKVDNGLYAGFEACIMYVKQAMQNHQGLCAQYLKASPPIQYSTVDGCCIKDGIYIPTSTVAEPSPQLQIPESDSPKIHVGAAPIPNQSNIHQTPTPSTALQRTAKEKPPENHDCLPPMQDMNKTANSANLIMSMNSPRPHYPPEDIHAAEPHNLTPDQLGFQNFYYPSVSNPHFHQPHQRLVPDPATFCLPREQELAANPGYGPMVGAPVSPTMNLNNSYYMPSPNMVLPVSFNKSSDSVASPGENILPVQSPSYTPSQQPHTDPVIHNAISTSNPSPETWMPTTLREQVASPVNDRFIFPITSPDLYYNILCDAKRLSMFNRAKTLLHHQPVLLQNGQCTSLNVSLLAQSNNDYQMDQIFGKPLSPEAYWLLAHGCISSNILGHILSGVMFELNPLLNSPTYEAYLQDIYTLRQKTIALVGPALSNSLLSTDIVLVRGYAENLSLMQNQAYGLDQKYPRISAFELSYTLDYLKKQSLNAQNIRHVKAGPSDSGNSQDQPNKQFSTDTHDTILISVNSTPLGVQNGTETDNTEKRGNDYFEAIMLNNAMKILSSEWRGEEDILAFVEGVQNCRYNRPAFGSAFPEVNDQKNPDSCPCLDSSEPEIMASSRAICCTTLLQLIRNKAQYQEHIKPEATREIAEPASSWPRLYINVIARALQLAGYIEPYYTALTHWGYALHLIEPDFIEAGLAALELLKHGKLDGSVLISTPKDCCTEVPEILLSARVFSLIIMEIHPVNWSGPIDRDLLAFNSLTRACFKTLRNLFEMSLLNVLMTHRNCAAPTDYPFVAKRLLWSQETNTGLGMVIKSLEVEGPEEQHLRFQTAKNLRRDLERGFRFWASLVNAVCYLSVNQVISQEINCLFESTNKLLQSLKPKLNLIKTVT